MVVLAVGSVRYGRLPIIVHTVYIANVLYKASFISLSAFFIKKIYCFNILLQVTFYVSQHFETVILFIEGVETCCFQCFMHHFHLCILPGL